MNCGSSRIDSSNNFAASSYFWSTNALTPLFSASRARSLVIKPHPEREMAATITSVTSHFLLTLIMASRLINICARGPELLADVLGCQQADVQNTGALRDVDDPDHIAVRELG